MTLQPNQFLYVELREIGRGGLGVVHEIEVTDSNPPMLIGTRMAKKKLNEQWASNQTMLLRFEREIKTLKLMNHPGILKIKGENLSGDKRFYCMDVYKGSLRDWINSRKIRPTIQEVADHFADIASALSYAHNLGHIHRDIKPENILHTNENIPVVADWGLGYFIHKNSMVLSKSLTYGGMGTEYYCSAEQWSTGKCGPEGDVYSLGVTMAEVLICGQIPIPIVGGGIQVDVVNPSAPGGMQMNALIKMMTKPYITQRMQSMESVQKALTTIARQAA